MAPTPAERAAEDPVVTVVVPCYNQGRFLGDAVDSLLAQRPLVPEVIVVDDGSTDDTAAVARRYGDEIRLLQRANGGLSAARNTGLAEARGEFIAFLDADDAWEPDYLARALPVISAPGTALVYTCHALVDEAGEFLRHGGQVIESGRFADQILRGSPFPPSSALMRTEAARELGGFDESLTSVEDRDLWYRMLGRGDFRGLPQPLVRYRQHAHNMSRNIDRMAANRERFLNKHFGPDEGDPSRWEEKKRRAYAYTYRQTALGYLETGDRERAIEWLGRAAARWPNVLLDLETYYELVCGEQSRSDRGRAELLDLEARALAVESIIETILRDGPAELRARRRALRARSLLALGMLADSAGRARGARSWFLRAAVADPVLALRHRVPRRLVRLALGPWGGWLRGRAAGDRR